MKKALLTVNFNLSNNVAIQLENFDSLLSELNKRGFHFEEKVISNLPNLPKVIGPNEDEYLKVSGRSRMNIRDKSLSREAQAAKYLIEKGITPPVALEDCVSENTTAMPAASEYEQPDIDSDFSGDPTDFS